MSKLRLTGLTISLMTATCIPHAWAGVTTTYGGESTSITSYTGPNANPSLWDYVYTASWSGVAPGQWGIDASSASSVYNVTGGDSWTGQFFANQAAYDSYVTANYSSYSKTNMDYLFGHGSGAVVWFYNSGNSTSITFHYASQDTPGLANAPNGSSSTAPFWISDASTQGTNNGSIYTATPEPSSFLLLGVGLLGLPLKRWLAGRRRENKCVKNE